MNTAYRLLVSITIITSIVLVIGLWHVGSNSMIACGFLGAAFIFFGARPNRGQIGLVLMSSVALVLIYTIGRGPFSPDLSSYIIGLGSFVGSGSILVMALDMVWTKSTRFASPLKNSLILPVFSLVAGLSMQFANAAPHSSYDLLLYRFDSSLGFSERSVAMLFRHWPLIGFLSGLVYKSLLIFPPLYCGWATFTGKGKFNLMYAFVIAGVSGFLLYNICPAMGPLYAFGQHFPDSLPNMNQVLPVSMLTTGVNNAMPSMHMTWALLMWVAAWEIGGGFSITLASLFVGFTGLATMGFGEHYLIDLVVAVPLVMMVRGICRLHYLQTLIGLVLVVAWTVFLRTGVLLPAGLEWSLIAATVSVGLLVSIGSTFKLDMSLASLESQFVHHSVVLAFKLVGLSAPPLL